MTHLSFLIRKLSPRIFSQNIGATFWGPVCQCDECPRVNDLISAQNFLFIGIWPVVFRHQTSFYCSSSTWPTRRHVGLWLESRFRQNIKYHILISFNLRGLRLLGPSIDLCSPILTHSRTNGKVPLSTLLDVLMDKVSVLENSENVIQNRNICPYGSFFISNPRTPLLIDTWRNMRFYWDYILRPRTNVFFSLDLIWSMEKVSM